jgi:predicted anti-sigma-YlaC factor YlaD
MMMEHIDYLLSAYLDGELSQREKVVVERHMADCGECHGLYQEFVQMREEWQQAYDTFSVPDALTFRILTAIEQKEAEVATRTFFSNEVLRWGAISGILLLLMVHVALVSVFHFVLSFHPLNFLIPLSRGVYTVVTSVPYVSSVLLVVSVSFMLLSGWCLRRLLSSKKVEVML